MPDWFFEEAMLTLDATSDMTIIYVTVFTNMTGKPLTWSQAIELKGLLTVETGLSACQIGRWET